MTDEVGYISAITDIIIELVHRLDSESAECCVYLEKLLAECKEKNGGEEDEHSDIYNSNNSTDC